VIPLTASELAALAGGRLVAGDPEARVTGVSIDSRTIRPGDLFVALPGARTDGHAFLADAAGRGAAALLVREAAGAPAGVAVVRVDDPATALARLAAGVRRRLRARVVAITGSSGKTVTKELTAAVAGARYRVTASRGSENNEIGVPLTVLAADERTEVLVAEVGSRGIGHIRALAPVLSPHVGVVLNVGPAHLGMFGSLAAVAEAKGELVEVLDEGGVAVLSADDDAVRAMAARTRARPVTFGRSAEADVRAEEVTLDADARASFVLVAGGRRAPVALRIPGEHLVSDALAAAAAGMALGVEVEEAARALGTVDPPRSRMQVLDAPGGWRVVNDAYNANPASVAAALRALVAMGRGRRTWAVLGVMAELGDASRAEHERIGRLAVRLGVSRLLAVGEEARPVVEAARLEGMPPEEAVPVADADEAVAALRAALAPGDVVLVKASRVAGLDRVAEALAAPRSAVGSPGGAA
jgi:UDP-N-acetylmuramoyl-tripeptide--D-alanyl-D-alanine ligase